jgi:hypothetical protein
MLRSLRHSQLSHQRLLRCLMSSPDCKRRKLADDVNSVAKMSNVSPTKNWETQTDNVTITESASNQRSVIDLNAQSFEDIANLDGFVDRTMLTKELLQEEPTYAMIFAPSKFGKTVNLSMIRLFCDIEDKNTKTKEDVTTDPTMEELRSNPSKNMKVFLRQFADTQYEECLILEQENFVIQHFGRHPVVFFNFKDCNVKNESGAIFYCAMKVRDGYLENDYLKNSKEFQSGDPEHVHLKQTCSNWLSYSDDKLESLSVMEVIFGLQDLIKSLRIHWGRDPVFLVDEIDKPGIAAMEHGVSESQVRKIGITITNVLSSILKSADKQLKLQAALLTGICKLEYSTLSPMDKTVAVYFLSDRRFSKYYGLTGGEVDSLVRKFYGPQGDAEIKNIISHINANYSGYNEPSYYGKKYCLFSVLNFIKEINKDKNKVNLCFWTDGGFLTGKLPILKNYEVIMIALHKLLYGDSGTIAIRYKSAINVEHLLGLYREEMDLYPNGIFNFFLQRGYLAVIEFEGRETIHVRIPNLEIKNIYHQMLEDYHNELPEAIKSKFTSCGQIFKSLPTQDSTEFQESLEKLCEDLKCIFRSKQCKSEGSICSQILAILKLHTDYENCEMEHRVRYYLGEYDSEIDANIDVWGRCGNFAVIFEVKYNFDARSEPDKIGSEAKSSLAAAENIIVKLLPHKLGPEDCRPLSTCQGKRQHVKMLKFNKIEHYVLVGLAVDGDYTTHMLVFRDTDDWKNVIQVNPENHVAEIISNELKKSS